MPALTALPVTIPGLSRPLKSKADGAALTSLTAIRDFCLAAFNSDVPKMFSFGDGMMAERILAKFEGFDKTEMNFEPQELNWLLAQFPLRAHYYFGGPDSARMFRLVKQSIKEEEKEIDSEKCHHGVTGNCDFCNADPGKNRE